MLIRATRKLLKYNKKIELAPLDSEPENILSEWYADIMSSTFPGKMIVVFLHAKSNTTVITEGKSLKTCYPLFLSRLNSLMNRFNFPQKFIENFKNNATDYKLSKTNNKRINGHFNAVKNNIDAHLFNAMSYENIDYEILENIQMKAPFTDEKKRFFTPILFWNAYFNGEDIPDNYEDRQSLNTIVKLNEDHTSLTKVEDLYMENEIMKVEIEQRLGGVFATDTEINIDPEIENMFLKQIMAFENSKDNFIKTTAAKLIGNIKFPPSSTLTPIQLNKQLERLIKKLHKVNITVDFLANYTDLVKYNFLRDELLHEEIDHLDIPGMIHGFIYEEFHPNHDYDLRNLFRVFFHYIESDTYDISTLSHIMSEPLIFNDKTLDFEGFAENIRFYKLGNSFVNTMHYKIELIKFDMENNHAEITGFIKEHQKKRVHFLVNVSYSHEFWEINNINFF